jgi:hypothetical protein
MFPGLLIDDSGASDFVPKVDSKIRRIKELYRAMKNGLPWKLPIALMKHLMCYAVGRLNLRRTSSLASSMSPYRLFTGTRVNYKKLLLLAFRDYAEIYDGSNNTSRSRSLPCIALHPCNNSTGSWEFLNLTTGARIRRSYWRRMLTTQAIIDKMNSMTSGAIEEEVQEVPAPQQDVNPPAVEEINPEPVQTVPGLAEPELPNPRDEAANEEVHEAQVIPVCRSSRIAGGVRSPQRYVLLTIIKKAISMMEDVMGKAKLAAIQKELIQIFQELKAVNPVMRHDIQEDA